MGTAATDASVATAETRNLNTYCALTTAGPAIAATITASGKALVTINVSTATETFRETCQMFFAVSGATTQVVADAKSVRLNDDAGITHRAGATYLVTGLTAGVNTFTAQYEANNDQGGTNNTCTFSDRNLVVIPWPN